LNNGTSLRFTMHKIDPCISTKIINNGKKET